MFTGLIREIAEVRAFEKNVLKLKAKYRPNVGDSIAVNGACLSVTKVYEGGFEVELSHESLEVLALENYKDKVHIEPAMKLGDRLEGHIIQGHIDTVGVIEKIIKKPGGYDFYIKIPPQFIKFVIPKGSIAVEGVSLTVNDVFEDSFRLTIIPLTMKETLFGIYTPGRRVNIETDMFARYLYYMFKKEKSLHWSDIDKIQALY
ncbi:riboflavin synthase [Nitrosophilus alvini]|uniref:riboflavin synthase n=1 Tax=Nitrosophilus alvini TaxID=2714855 RepID=UPI0019099A00|nr:riboflavin synthase [Nitrosophilus alvini]